MSSMEHTFFVAACRQLDLSSANGDRLIDCLRTAMLLSAYSYTSGRFHEVRIYESIFVCLTMPRDGSWQAWLSGGHQLLLPSPSLTADLDWSCRPVCTRSSPASSDLNRQRTSFCGTGCTSYRHRKTLLSSQSAYIPCEPMIAIEGCR